jgi:superfamily II DNA or RNA helicase
MRRVSYPDIEDENFNEKITKKYSKYYIPDDKKSMRQICYPEKITLQMPQRFLADFIHPETPYKGILVYHRIGAGKSCTAINIAEHFKLQKHIIVVLPASLINNFRDEFRTPWCTGNKYISKNERVLLSKLDPTSQRYSDVIDRTNKRIDKYYSIYSYNKFINLLDSGKIDLNNTLLIIDEIHNMISCTIMFTRHQTLSEW